MARHHIIAGLGSFVVWCVLAVAALANPPALVELFAETIVEELDFRLEAENMLDIARIFAVTDQRTMVVPRPHPYWVSRRVLVMERMRGFAFDDVESMHDAGLDTNAILRAGLIACLEGARQMDGMARPSRVRKFWQVEEHTLALRSQPAPGDYQFDSKFWQITYQRDICPPARRNLADFAGQAKVLGGVQGRHLGSIPAACGSTPRSRLPSRRRQRRRYGQAWWTSIAGVATWGRRQR